MPRKVGSKEKIANYLKTRVGETVTSKEIQDVSGGAVQYSRRLRELRAEGWRISSVRDRPDLKPNEYMLEEEPPESPYTFSRAISKRVRAEVLERNGYTCQMCGAAAGDKDEEGRIVVLQMGHIKDKSMGGTDEVSNLRALCSSFNGGAKNITMMPPTRIWLLAQVRRANIEDQRTVLEWLEGKFKKPSKTNG